MIFEEITFSARVAFWTRFWTLLASLSGAFWPPRWLKPLSEFLLERPRAVQEFFFCPKSDPRGFQERPKAPESPPLADQALFRAPRDLQEPSKRLPRGLQGQFGSHFGTILDPFWSNFEAMLPPCWSRFLAEGSFAQGPQSNTPGPAECA